ncbi:MAG: FAD-binding protein [Caldilineaceae bacterium]
MRSECAAPRGLVINTKRLDRILELTLDYARVEAGTLLITMEKAAQADQPSYASHPSTLSMATVGGFLAGGSGGVGSVTWGTLWDPGNVLGATVVTVRPSRACSPSRCRGTQRRYPQLRPELHHQPTNASARPGQPVVAICGDFPDLDDVALWPEALAYDDAVDKRPLRCWNGRSPASFANWCGLMPRWRVGRRCFSCSPWARKRSSVGSTVTAASCTGAAHPRSISTARFCSRTSLEPHDALGDEGRQPLDLSARSI